MKLRIIKGEALIMACSTRLQNQPSFQVVVSRLPCKSPIGRTLELEPWFLFRFPVRFFPLGVSWAGFFWPPSERFYLSCKRELSSAKFPRVLLHFLANSRLALKLQCCTPPVRVMPFNTWLLNSLSQITSCCMYFAEMVLSKPSFAYTLSLLLSTTVKI